MRAPHLKLDSKNNGMPALITFKWGARGQFCLKFDAVFLQIVPLKLNFDIIWSVFRSEHSDEIPSRYALP